MNIGILTGGGDCPGLNAVIRAVVRRSLHYGHSVLGIMQGWKGLIENKTRELSINNVSGILHVGGTILGTSRTNPYKAKDTEEKVKRNFKELSLDALVAVGGEDTLGVANKLFKEGFPVVGVPKTIDNDLNGTDFTFGFDTAITIATEAIDRLHTTAESHNRVIVCEVMGRHAGWIATYAGIAGGADYILIPEQETNIHDLCNAIQERSLRGKTFSIIVVAEGAKICDPEENKNKEVYSQTKKDEFGHAILGGIGNVLAEKLEKITGHETRVTVLGHIQRGGTPTPYDRVLATRFGVYATDLVHKKIFGKMVALKGNEIIDVPLDEAVKELKTLDMRLYDIAKVFFG
jgi:6-phosphofructokinase 1